MPPRRKKSSKVETKKPLKRNSSDSKDSDDEPKSKKVKTEGKGETKGEFDPNCKASSPSGKEWNLKISSWNINGIRSWIQKSGTEYLKKENPDMFCVMETKCSTNKLPPESEIDGYKAYWLSGDAEGYSGVGLYTKTEPLNVTYGIDVEKHDKEGRVITAEYDNFYLVLTYIPNAGRKLVRLDYRMEWDKDFQKYLKELDSKKPVILCGDLNVAHEEIDIANVKGNKRNAGFTQEERDSFSKLLNSGFIDSFRHLHPDTEAAYTFWTYMMNARAKNVGWRLDYFVLSERLIPNLCESLIRSKVMGSDHCPITLLMAF